ncbi:protein VAPYRIN-like [Dioscorea cayenensis subsp. rotundata]|uniref:Protein VAPYRIN-like n=1 Tax=Dioscorea cayennensis subsp. rotundata TaxID=55577 RepID=A0AB40BQX8_DIOCR|nr:protein VAPYRIN-like [Dioscorea cayenensis subsp. rotundata]
MDRLISLEPSNQVCVRIEPGHKCTGDLTLRNVMYTMPVAFRIQPANRSRYSVKPQSGIIAPLSVLKVEIIYTPSSSHELLPDSYPDSDDPFQLCSVVVPGAGVKDINSALDSVPNDWFTAKKKQVFTDSGIKVFFVGSAVLTRLVSDGAMETVREVLEKSEPEWRAVDSVDAHGETLLHLSIVRSRPDLVQMLLEFEPNLEKANRAGRTPIEEAAAAGESLIVELLLARRASTERSLHHAVAAGHTEVMRLLLLKGAEVNAVTSDGRTALHLAACERRWDCARLLLASGARTDVRGGEEGNTPLHVAAACGDEKMVRVLLGKGGAGTKETRNKLGRTAFDVAGEGGHGKLFDMLKLGDGLCVAARKGEARGVVRLVERGAAVNGRDGNGWTALMRAGFKGRVEIMKLLMEMGVEIEARDEEGYTALHCAVEAGQAEAVELLVKRGAEVEARTAKGATAMHIAGSLGYVGIMRILSLGGASKEKMMMKKVVVGGGGGGGSLKDMKRKSSGKKMMLRGSSGRGLDRSATLPVTCSH